MTLLPDLSHKASEHFVVMWAPIEHDITCLLKTGLIPMSSMESTGNLLGPISVIPN